MNRTKRVTDPYPGQGGGPLHPVLALGAVLIFLSFGIASWTVGSFEGGYDQVEKLASVKCLGCLGLDPIVPDFRGFWTVYPEGHSNAGEEVKHPVWIKDALSREDVDLIILFYWTPGCVPCAEQWKEMKRERIASGDEDGGREGDRYKGLLLYSLDASKFESMDIDLLGRTVEIVPNDLFWTYHFNGDLRYNGVPGTVFIFQSDDQIEWYMHYGRMDISSVNGMITDILYNEISHA